MVGAGETGQRFVDPNHPYSADLDIFGKGSLFQLVCGARTSAGEATLASWLVNLRAKTRFEAAKPGLMNSGPNSTCGKIFSCSVKMFGPDFTPTFFGNGGRPTGCDSGLCAHRYMGPECATVMRWPDTSCRCSLSARSFWACCSRLRC